ncbi:MAG: prepilin-type N-terminal cleavage/methylation domain-containing protein [Rickettsiales bacterium]|nr:prepilin-type N-terminal cleavage/methylation domain-containing protein [Rickettsiales bacterium]
MAKCPTKYHAQAGYTLVELLLAVIVGSIVLAGSYASYTVVARQGDKIAARGGVQESGMPTLRRIGRDLRMAGHKELDDNMESPIGAINNPVNVVDSGNACCDQLEIIYDVDTATRQQIIYYVAERQNPTRNALFMDIKNWNGGMWVDSMTGALVTDYVEDFQVETSNPGVKGIPKLVDLSLVLRARFPMANPDLYQKPDYEVGNHVIAVNDNYYREEFGASFYLRNIR